MTFAREAFASYPDRVMAMKVTASKKGALSFDLVPDAPYLRPFTGSGTQTDGRAAKISARGNEIEIVQHLQFHDVRFYGLVKVVADGSVAPAQGVLKVRGATEATVYFSCGTNYRLEPKSFTIGATRVAKEAVLDADPSIAKPVRARVESALKRGYDAVKDAHVALYPGTLINANRPDWMKAARYTLDERGDNSTGWALAHRMNCRARLGDGDRALKLLRVMLAKRTYNNLWDMHPPFQIDGNFGATSAVAEMLLQSQAGYIDLLPALAKDWASQGSFKGLCARGAMKVDCEWKDGKPVSVTVYAPEGAQVDVRFAGKKFEKLTIVRRSIRSSRPCR